MRFGGVYISVWLLKKMMKEDKTEIIIDHGDSHDTALFWFLMIVIAVILDWCAFGMYFTTYVVETIRWLTVLVGIE